MKKNIVFLLFYIAILTGFDCKGVKQFINENDNALEKLYEYNIVQEGDAVRLHLGCGQNHFDDYVNIDFPPSEHTVQTTVGADVFADIVMLHFPENSIDEIRSHHVFEHFDRATALGLLCKWHKWLKVGGKLVIETPDFKGCVQFFMSPRSSYKRKQEVLRHLFGSHEAHWAIHCDGWYKEKLEFTLNKLGFGNISCREYMYAVVLYNVIVTAYKKETMSDSKLRTAVKAILDYSQIGRGGKLIMETWLGIFDKTFK